MFCACAFVGMSTFSPVYLFFVTAPQNAETLTAGAKYKKYPIPILTFHIVCGTYANSADPD